MLDRTDRWQGTRSAPVDLGDVRDTLTSRAREYRASTVVDPRQTVLIAQEARAAGVIVTEFPFTAASVGRIALSLHQAIRGHRIALPDDETLLDELASVRLRKNTLGIYSLDHDAGLHDDQAIALALGAHYLLDADGSAEIWIRWAREKAIAAGAVIVDGQVSAVPEPPRRPAIAAARPEPEPVLTGVVLDPVAARKLARDQRFRESPDGIMLHFLNDGGLRRYAARRDPVSLSTRPPRTVPARPSSAPA